MLKIISWTFMNSLSTIIILLGTLGLVGLSILCLFLSGVEIGNASDIPVQIKVASAIVALSVIPFFGKLRKIINKSFGEK